jgi:hypothetical protein
MYLENGWAEFHRWNLDDLQRGTTPVNSFSYAVHEHHGVQLAQAAEANTVDVIDGSE